MVSAPSTNAEDYIDESELAEDDADATPKHGTSIQSGWGAAKEALDKKTGDYPTDLKFSEQPQLLRFMENEPFSVYFQHWIDHNSPDTKKKSFVCLGDECPLCTIAGDKPRVKCAFNVLVLTDEEPNVQILTAAPTLARQVQAANDDARRGPLTKHYWAVSRHGTGPQTAYALERVRATELAEEWDLDQVKVEEAAGKATGYDTTAIYVSPKDELLKLARYLVTNAS